MYFKISKNTSEIPLYSTNEELNNRWSVLTPEKLEQDIGGKWNWFRPVTDPTINDKRKRERTRLYLGYDSVVDRPVIVKVLQYSPDDLKDIESVNKKRRVLIEQINILNDILSPLLPEPLDWFQVKNTVDPLPSEELSSTEPILVLDYQPGIALNYYIDKKSFRVYKTNEGKINIERVFRLISYINYFLKTVYEKGYMYVGLSPEHILLLNDDVPRFIGIGSICKIKDGNLDFDHINFGRTKKGYSAPELNDFSNGFKICADAKAAGIFSIGVILAQILCETTKLDDDILEKGAFKYPNPTYEARIKRLRKGDRIHYLLTRLCDPNPKTRLSDFDKIEEILEELRGDRQRRDKAKEFKREKLKEINDNLGSVKFYNANEGFGYVRDAVFDEEYRISSKTLERSNVNRVYENQNIKFNLLEGKDGKFINTIDILKNNETIYSKPQQMELEKREREYKKRLEKKRLEEIRKREEERKLEEERKYRERLEEIRLEKIRKREEERKLEEKRKLEERKLQEQKKKGWLFSWGK